MENLLYEGSVKKGGDIINFVPFMHERSGETSGLVEKQQGIAYKGENGNLERGEKVIRDYSGEHI